MKLEMKLNKKFLPRVRLAVQVLFLTLTVLGVHFGSMLVRRLSMFALFFLIGTYFCGWICPFGTIQDLLWRFNRRFIKREIKIPLKIDRWLSWLRYVTLFVALGAILNILDSRRAVLMALGGNSPLTAALVVLVIILLLSLFMKRPFCRYLCPEGARYGAAGLARIFTVTRNNSLCVHCKACDRACPMAIPVSQSSDAGLNTPQCISCASCLSACPKTGALTLKPRRLTRIVTLAFFLIGLYFWVSSVRFTWNRFNPSGAALTAGQGQQNQPQRLHDGKGPHGGHGAQNRNMPDGSPD